METIPVYVNEDPYLAVVITQLVTRSGQYYNLSNARNDIGSGRVRVNGIVQRKPHSVFLPGTYIITVGPNAYSVRLSNSAKE